MTAIQSSSNLVETEKCFFLYYYCHMDDSSQTAAHHVFFTNNVGTRPLPIAGMPYTISYHYKYVQTN